MDADEKYSLLMARMATSLAELHMDAIKAIPELCWEAAAYANLLALRSVANLMTEDGQDAADAALRDVIEQAFKQQVIAKRFKNKASMERWMAEQGIQDPSGPEANDPVH